MTAKASSNESCNCCLVQSVSCLHKTVTIGRLTIFVLSIFALFVGSYFIWRGFPSWFGEIRSISPLQVGILTLGAGVIGLIAASVFHYCCPC